MRVLLCVLSIQSLYRLWQFAAIGLGDSPPISLILECDLHPHLIDLVLDELGRRRIEWQFLRNPFEFPLGAGVVGLMGHFIVIH